MAISESMKSRDEDSSWSKQRTICSKFDHSVDFSEEEGRQDAGIFVRPSRGTASVAGFESGTLPKHTIVRVLFWWLPRDS
jgi:hypothetical protein